MRSTFPGGLRVQLLIGLSVLLAGSFALAAVLVENVLTRRLLAAQQQHLEAVVDVASRMPPAVRGVLVDEAVVDALVVGDERYGPPAVVNRLQQGEASQFVRVQEALYLRVAREDVVVALRVDSVRRDVADARSTLVVFGLLVVIVVLALGYGFFSFLVVRPIRAIGVATERAAQGDLASSIKIVPRNEIGGVAQSFNEMLVQIDRSRDELERKVQELEQANTELETTRDSLVRSEKLASVGQLAAGIAHEIGNPLAALSGYNELLRDGELGHDESDDLLRRSSEQLDRIRGVIRNLLDFSRDEAASEPAPTSLAQCVEESVSLVRASARGRDVTFVVHEVEGPPVYAVSSQIVQVLVNLGINAVDALSSGGRIEIKRFDDDGVALLWVEDDGLGVPEELVQRIFDPFFTTKDPGDGTGLGLAISARIIESFGGELSVTTSELGGARFVVRLRHAEVEDGA